MRVPPLILQPLVENAIHHGVARSEAPLTIRIAAADRGDQVALVVEDDGKAGPIEAESAPGSASPMSRRACRTHYDGDASLTAAPRPEGGYRAELAFPRGTD